MDLVSICIPVYNGQDFLAAALDSALAQTYRNVEILIVEDGSSDASVAIAAHYAERYPSVRLIANPQNYGLVGNWNRCVELARGTWIKFLFQDDLLSPDCVARLLELGQNGWPFVACDREFLFEGAVSDELVEFYRRNRAHVHAVFRGQAGCTAIEYVAQALPELQRNWIGEPSATLIRADVFATYGLFNPALSQLCDLEFWHRLGGNVGIGFVPRTLASFRVHAGGATAKNQGNRRFLSSSLDKLALLHTAARSPHCSSFRKQADGSGTAHALERAFRGRAHTVFEWVRLHGTEPCGQTTVSLAYRTFLNCQPECRVWPVSHIAWRLRSNWWHLMQLLRRQ